MIRAVTGSGIGDVFHSTAFQWAVDGRSLLGHLVTAGTSFGWPLRLIQGGAAVTAGAAVLWRARRSEHALWLVPFVVVAARLLLDPLDNAYYFLGLATPALVALALVAGSPRRRLVAPSETVQS